MCIVAVDENAQRRQMVGIDKLTIFVPKSGYLVRCAGRDYIAEGAGVEIWSEKRRIG